MRKIEITSKCFSSGWWPCYQLVGCWAICFLGTSVEAPTISSLTLTTKTIIIQDIMLQITTILTIHMEKNLVITVRTITMGSTQTRVNTRTGQGGGGRTGRILWVN